MEIFIFILDILTLNFLLDFNKESERVISFMGKISKFFKGKVILITGGTGSFGKKFVEIGKKIKKGDTVMIVEAMKTMNHVPSSKDGVVKKIVVDDGQPVEFGQTLVILE